MSNPFPEVNLTRTQARQAESSADGVQIAAIKSLIESASKDGKFEINVSGTLRPGVRALLSDAGYNVTTHNSSLTAARGEASFIIDWK